MISFEFFSFTFPEDCNTFGSHDRVATRLSHSLPHEFWNQLRTLLRERTELQKSFGEPLLSEKAKNKRNDKSDRQVNFCSKKQQNE